MTIMKGAADKIDLGICGNGKESAWSLVYQARVDEEEGSLLQNRVKRMNDIRENREISGSPPDNECLYLSHWIEN